MTSSPLPDSQRTGRQPGGSLLADLRRALSEHRPSDDEERGFLDQMLAVLAGGTESWRRDHYAPGHFTASAFVLDPLGGELLLIHHGKLHRWLQPGGHLDEGDPTVEAGARREVAEEVGLSSGLTRVGPGVFDVDVHVIPARPAKGEPEHLHLDVRFLFQADQREVAAGSDALDARWVAFDDVSEHESDRSVMRAVEKLRRR